MNEMTYREWVELVKKIVSDLSYMDDRSFERFVKLLKVLLDNNKK